MNEDQILEKLEAIEKQWLYEVESFKNKNCLYSRKFKDEILDIFEKDQFKGTLSSYCIRRINFAEWNFAKDYLKLK